jgi:hypothetical protein
MKKCPKCGKSRCKCGYRSLLSLLLAFVLLVTTLAILPANAQSPTPTPTPVVKKSKPFYKKALFWAGVLFTAGILYAVREKYRDPLPPRPAPALPTTYGPGHAWSTEEAQVQLPMHCTAFTLAQTLKAEPHRVKNVPPVDELLKGCQQHDGIQDGAWAGSKPRACAEYAKRTGLIKSWYDLKTPDQVLSYLQHKGPVMWGSRWPFELGIAGINPSAFPSRLRDPLTDEPGGHSVVLIGYSLLGDCYGGDLDLLQEGRKGYVTFLDHKGADYGLRGTLRICMDDFKRMLADSKTEAVGIER